ncbi:MAG: type II secretion system F family protein [Candidatus Omnitrophica bacterium]|nr:type II secretion system F family protein [Candidatus Omnitrophota bacterium]
MKKRKKINMKQFYYKAKDGMQNVVEGQVSALSREQAIAQLVQKKLAPLLVQDVLERVVVKPQVKKNLLQGWSAFVSRVRTKDVVLFTRQMSDLIGAAVPILRSLQIVEHQTRHEALKECVQGMYEAVRDGAAFSDALSQYKNIFSALYINMVKTGELSGKLELTLERLADHLEKEMEVGQKIRGSLAYPAFILGVGALTVFVLLSFVIPRLTVIFEDMDQALPLPTIILLKVSGFFAAYWWAVLLGIFVGGGYVWQWSRSDHGRVWIDRKKLQLPLLGEFIKQAEMGRFARTLATMLDTGVSITIALKAVARMIDNVILREQIMHISDLVANGASLRNAVAQAKFIPEMAVNMISIGEETGKLEKGLYKVADVYEKQTAETMKTAITLLGPAVLVFIIVIVGFVVIAMLLPIFQMNTMIK